MSNVETSGIPGAANASPPVKSFDHTGFTVASLDRSLAFWVGALEFKHLHTLTFDPSPFVDEVVGVPGAALRVAMLQGPGHMIELLEFAAPANRETYKPRLCDVGSAHVALYVADIDALLSKVARLGWHPLGKPQTVAYGESKGLRLVHVQGPDGVTVEFLQRAADAQA